MGFFVLPVLPVGYQLALELLFPVGEALVVGVLTISVSLYSILMLVLMSFLI